MIGDKIEEALDFQASLDHIIYKDFYKKLPSQGSRFRIFKGATHVNVSHVNHDLSFALMFPGLQNPLDDTNRILHGARRTFEYYIKHQLEANLPSGSELASNGSSVIVISMLDEVAWLLNLRGNDVLHSPAIYAYLIVKMDTAKLFVDNFKVTP
ncbi:aminopeptidase P2 [Tanacetum coccineum]